jgi:hypothetical protein
LTQLRPNFSRVIPIPPALGHSIGRLRSSTLHPLITTSGVQPQMAMTMDRKSAMFLLLGVISSQMSLLNGLYNPPMPMPFHLPIFVILPRLPLHRSINHQMLALVRTRFPLVDNGLFLEHNNTEVFHFPNFIGIVMLQFNQMTIPRILLLPNRLVLLFHIFLTRMRLLTLRELNWLSRKIYQKSTTTKGVMYALNIDNK